MAQLNLLFAPQLITAIADAEGSDWQRLFDQKLAKGADAIDEISIVLIVARMANCLSCSANTYRASLGCILCAKQTLKRFQGTKEDAAHVYEEARLEVANYLEKCHHEC